MFGNLIFLKRCVNMIVFGVHVYKRLAMTKKKNDCDGQKKKKLYEERPKKKSQTENKFQYKVYDMVGYYTCSVKDEKKKINSFVR